MHASIRCLRTMPFTMPFSQRHRQTGRFSNPAPTPWTKDNALPQSAAHPHPLPPPEGEKEIKQYAAVRIRHPPLWAVPLPTISFPTK
ncbi:uncharacterized protein BO95DRAFT_30675 [Aspergillus brunneoviolaceus CBS 621.78]|uniref:Uncharacterized protein n=1 Tax=Aspergillus brunneoviolaceus CBS 621.78 TaxID=1450534 RepID=A0ACD1FSX1_9EURO|nr:hypothetical protein BO95DRAFT_30675 [Aspergillus brunneoviolaceus CBS 621.78]RAH40036.1 hypothetical protein BO95DRAFT_30675 [Aspergillus brunneoviolaceus CBS 621.78]